MGCAGSKQGPPGPPAEWQSRYGSMVPCEAKDMKGILKTLYADAGRQLEEDPTAKSFGVLGKPSAYQFAYRIFPESYAKKVYWITTFDSQADFEAP